MTHETTIGSVNLIIHYENGPSGLELGTILMENQSGGYCDVTELIWELTQAKVSPFNTWEREITESLNEKPSHLCED